MSRDSTFRDSPLQAEDLRSDRVSGGEASRRERLVCPDCGEPLRRQKDRLHCSDCRSGWPVLGDTPHFIPEVPYRGELPLEQMRAVVRQARNGPWRTALLQGTAGRARQSAEAALNADKANWQWLLDLAADSRVLDMGAGWGVNAQALAGHYGQVVALEPVLESVQFMERRFAQEGLANIQLLRSSIWRLPFPSESFDLVVMDGTLARLAADRPGAPATVQRAALRRAHRLLRPGGYLYLAAANRFSLACLAGRGEAYGPPLMPLLPRTLAHWYARATGYRGDGQYLYSSRGYRGLLRSAGFHEVDCYVVLPSQDEPRYLVPLQANIFRYYSENFNCAPGQWLRRVAYRLLLASRLLQHSESAFVMIARK